MKSKLLYSLIGILLLSVTGCAEDKTSSNNQNVNPSTSVEPGPYDHFGDPNWTQTSPGNIVGKYATVPGVPTEKEFKRINYIYAWAEEYSGNTLNERDWQYEINGNGGGNQEKQYYRSENGVVENDLLTIYGKKESFGGKSYTSARMTTQDKVYFHYGYVEAMINLPSFQGAWPAFWMLGQSYKSVGWSKCGELDILEAVNNDAIVHSTLHYGAPHQQTTIGTHTFDNASARKGWHHYEMTWDEEAITTYVDGIQIGKLGITMSKFSSFHQDFFFIVNFAIGGQWPEANKKGVDANAFTTPQEMKVDYIRVYQQYDI